MSKKLNPDEFDDLTEASEFAKRQAEFWHRHFSVYLKPRVRRTIFVVARQEKAPEEYVIHTY